MQSETAIIDVYLENIQTENNLVEYTENHLNNITLPFSRSNSSTFEIKKAVLDSQNIQSNKPVGNTEPDTNVHQFKEFFYQQYTSNMSPAASVSSDSLENSDIEEDYSERGTFQLKNGSVEVTNSYKKCSYKDIEKEIDKYYRDLDNKQYTELDIISTYVKGQKNLYSKSRQYLKFKLNVLTITCLILTTLVTIFTEFYCTVEWTKPLITTMNSVIFLFISLINYLKLDASVEKFSQISGFYDNIGISIELINSKLLFMQKESDRRNVITKNFKKIEKKMIENKKKEDVVVPPEIQKIYPIIYGLNIISFIKKSELYKKKIIEKFRDVKNEIQCVLHKWKIHEVSGIQKTKEENRVKYLYEIKNKICEEIMEFRVIYEVLEDIFTEEIRNSEKYSVIFIPFTAYLTPVKKEMHPIIMKQFLTC